MEVNSVPSNDCNGSPICQKIIFKIKKKIKTNPTVCVVILQPDLKKNKDNNEQDYITNVKTSIGK